MNDKKQIEEMAVIIAKQNCNQNGCENCDFAYEYGTKEESCEDYVSYCKMAEAFYNAGYRKREEGEWIEHIEKPSWLEDDVEVYYNCSVCGTSHWSITPPFCPNCGAHMKGGAE